MIRQNNGNTIAQFLLYMMQINILEESYGSVCHAKLQGIDAILSKKFQMPLLT